MERQALAPPAGLRIIAGAICCAAVVLIFPIFSILEGPFSPGLSSFLVLFFTYLTFLTFIFFLGCSIWNGSRMGRRITLVILWITSLISLCEAGTFVLLFSLGLLIYFYVPSVVTYFDWAEKSTSVFANDVPSVELVPFVAVENPATFWTETEKTLIIPKVLAFVVVLTMMGSMVASSLAATLSERHLSRGYQQVRYGDSEEKVLNLMGEPSSDFGDSSYTPQIGWERCKRWSSDGPWVHTVFFYDEVPGSHWIVGFDTNRRAVAKSELYCGW